MGAALDVNSGNLTLGYQVPGGSGRFADTRLITIEDYLVDPIDLVLSILTGMEILRPLSLLPVLSRLDASLLSLAAIGHQGGPNESDGDDWIISAPVVISLQAALDMM